MVTKFDSIIIDPDLDTRMRLKQATNSVHQFGAVKLQTDLDGAQSMLRGADHFDVIFISYRIPQDEITPFIKEAKGSAGGQDAAYILVLRTKDQESSTVTQNVLQGADGFLFEPYSVDQLVEITELAARVRKERQNAREEAAIAFLLKDIMHQIDLIAYVKATGHDVGRGLKKFRDMCRVLETLDEEKRQIYYNVVIKAFIDAPLPKKLTQKFYAGASSRVKKKMVAKIVDEMEKGASDD